MHADLAFILGLLDRHSPAFASAEDFAGVHGRALRCWQRLGFLSREPEASPVPSCPHCFEGAPSRLGSRFLCDRCHSTVDAAHLLRWRFHLDAFLSWLARRLTPDVSVQQVDESLWRLGFLVGGDLNRVCFFRRGGALSGEGRRRLLAFHEAVLLQCLPAAESVDGFAGPCLSLLDLLRQEKRTLKVVDLARLLDGPGSVRFDMESGALWVGNRPLGSLPLHSKEYHFLACLSRRAGEFVAYADLKRYVLQASGSREATDEATFCQKLKSRIKKRIPRIDELVTTTNKGSGYRLRRVREP